MSQWADMELQIKELRAYGAHWKTRAEAAEAERDEALEHAARSLKGWQGAVALAEAAEAERDRLREALEPFLVHPRWLSIGSFANMAEIRVSRRAYENARAALADQETTEVAIRITDEDTVVAVNKATPENRPEEKHGS